MFLHTDQHNAPILFSTFSALVAHLAKVGDKDVDYNFCVIYPDVPVKHNIIVRLTAGFSGETFVSGYMLKYDPGLVMRMNPMYEAIAGTSWTRWVQKNGWDISHMYEDHRVTREGSAVGYVNIENVVDREEPDWTQLPALK